jgi:phospholipid/cholesterol/gamma-HCH transport system ATP-binding protein
MALAELELKNISISFAHETILKNISFEIIKNESFVLIGPSGQGKSVLLKAAAGLIKPTSGELYICGKNFHQQSGASRQELLLKMGMLFQKNALFDSLTCGENIAFPLREVSDLTDAEISSTVDHFLEAVGIAHAKNLFPDEISGGMQKRLGIARALALKPEIIFYDDPTAGLDPITSKKIIELILNLKKENNSTVIAITNDMSRAYQMADRIAMVVDQSVIITGNVEQTKNHQDPRVHQFIRGDLQGPLMVNP